MSGQGGPGHLGGDLQVVQSPGRCDILSAPAAWQAPNRRDWVYYANSCGIAGYRLEPARSGGFHLVQRWAAKPGGSTPFLSGGVLFVAHAPDIFALDPLTGRVLLDTQGIGGVHWEYPIVVNKHLFLPDEGGHVWAYRVERASVR